jgi:alkylation response protein AidB-like acyl-CoA dehydrogenase
VTRGSYVADEMESLDDFRARAREWLAANMPRRVGAVDGEALAERAPELQAKLFDAGFAGIAFPREYGGAGLTLEHQEVFAQEMAPYETPVAFMVSIGMLAPTLLDNASEVLKLRHLPRILRGEEMWMQLLSEPSGGSDMAGALTRATRDGDTWILNGSKIWSSGAFTADYGMCLARTDWDAPKHRGLSMFAVPLQGTPGLTIEPIREANGNAEFCQEFFDDVVLPAENLIGAENTGWSVAQSLLLHERNAVAGVGYGAGLIGGDAEEGEGTFGGPTIAELIRLARSRGVAGEGPIRQLIAEAYVQSTVSAQLGQRVMTGMRVGTFPFQWGSLVKLGLGVDVPRLAEIAIAVSGDDGVIWPADAADADPAHFLLGCRAVSISGGSNEIQRNIVSERLLGLPREPSLDRVLPFSEVVRNRSTSTGAGSA